MKKKYILLLTAFILIGSIQIVFAASRYFSDVPENEWYSDAVHNLMQIGVIKGYDDGTFKPSKNVNRAELAVILNRMLYYLDTGLVSNRFVYCPDGDHIQSDNTDDSPDQAEMDKMQLFFDANALEYENFINCRLLDMVGQALNATHIYCYQFVNGLKVFYEDLRYAFDERYKLLEFGGMPDNKITEIDLDNSPSMNPNDVANLFINKVNNDSELTANEKKGILIGCHELEFGYYDLNAAKSFTDPNFTKAWHINSKYNTFVQACINDTTSEVIFYTNGIDS